MSKPSLRVIGDDGQATGGESVTQTSTHQSTIEKFDRQLRELDRIAGISEPKTVSIPLGKIVPLLLDAAANDRAWLNDFADDTIRIDADLYDVLLAYQQLQERSAA